MSTPPAARGARKSRRSTRQRHLFRGHGSIARQAQKGGLPQAYQLVPTICPCPNQSGLIRAAHLEIRRRCSDQISPPAAPHGRQERKIALVSWSWRGVLCDSWCKRDLVDVAEGDGRRGGLGLIHICCSQLHEQNPHAPPPGLFLPSRYIETAGTVVLCLTWDDSGRPEGAAIQALIVLQEP